MSRSEQLVMCALTRWMCERRVPPGDLKALAIALEGYANTPAAMGEERGRFTSQERARKPQSALKAAGLTAQQLRAQWELARSYDDLQAQLPEDTLAKLFPRELWPVVEQMILDGPRIARVRTEAALLYRSQQTPPAYAKRVGGPVMSASSVKNMAGVLSTLRGILVELRPAFPELLSEWVSAPTVRVPAAPSNVLNTSAPSWELVQETYDTLHQQALERLDCAPGEELQAIQQLSVHRQKSSFNALRNWAGFSLLTVTTARVSSLVSLPLSCLDMEAVLPSGRGPGLLLAPGKSWKAGAMSVKPLGEAVYPLQVLHAFLEEVYGPPVSGAALIPARPARPTVGWSSGAVLSWLAGEVGTQQLPALPTHPGSLVGYSPHRLRAAGLQRLEQPDVADYLRHHRIDIPQRYLGDVLADHAIPNLEQRYLGLNTPMGRAKAAQDTISILWKALSQPGPLVPPAPASMPAAHRQSLKAQLTQLEHELLALGESGLEPKRLSAQLLVLMARHSDVTIELAAP